MSTDVPPTPARARWSIWRWLLLAAALMCVFTAVAVYNLVTLSRDAVKLREQLLSAMDGRAQTRVQVSVGPVLLSAVRAGLAFVPDVPAEARVALRAVRSASVGVYHLPRAAKAAERSRMFAGADALMARRGWSRIVAVSDRDDLVMIYAPARSSFGSRQRVCVAVCDGDQLVIVAGTINAGALAELAARHGGLARL